MGRVDEALDCVNEHVQLGHGASRYADLPHALGYLYLMRGEITLAEMAYQRSLQLGASCEQVKGTGSYSSHFHLGLLKEASGDREGAVLCYKRALLDNPRYQPALNQLENPLAG